MCSHSVFGVSYFSLMSHRFLPQVQPGEGGKATLSDMPSLSGGERSFSTVCFVLSLWAIAEAPFRALDEFAVYMVKNIDNNNEHQIIILEWFLKDHVTQTGVTKLKIQL